MLNLSNFWGSLHLDTAPFLLLPIRVGLCHGAASSRIGGIDCQEDVGGCTRVHPYTPGEASSPGGYMF